MSNTSKHGGIGSRGGVSCHLRKVQRSTASSSFTFMSLNQRGRIVGQVVYPRVSADKKQKGHPVARPRPSVPPQDIIEISSDEDDEKTPPPPKRSPTNRVNQSTTNGPGYNARLDQQFQKLKRVRHRPLVYAFGLIFRNAEGGGVGTTCCHSKERNRGQEVSRHPCTPNPYFLSSSPPPLICPQKVDEIEEELTCDICAMRMWTPYRWVLTYLG